MKKINSIQFTDGTIRYLNEIQVSEITGRAVQSLRNDRRDRKGLPYTKFGRSVRYNQHDVINFMERNKIIPEG